jgi:mannose-6-phosphate isomerase-like protein (cupin superfamily)
MTDFAAKPLPTAADVLAPDGSEVRILLGLAGGGMAHFRLAPGQVAKAVTHRSVEEIWYILAGRGRMWRKSAAGEAVIDLAPGLCLTIPLGTRFQFRCDGEAALDAVAITMPPWPGADEAVIVDGPWPPTV